MPPLLFVAMRFTLVVFPCVFFIRKPDVSWKAIIGVGLLMSAGQFGLLYLAMALGMPAGLASLVLQAQVLLTVLLAAGILAERPTGGSWQASCWDCRARGGGGRPQPRGPRAALLIVLGAALSWAAGNVVARKAKAASGLGLVVWSGAVVPLPLAGLSLLVDGPAAVSGALMDLQPVTIASAIYTAAFGSLVGYGIWNRLLGLYPSSAVVPFTLLVPVVGMTTAWLVLAEVPSPAEVAGGLLLLAGVAVAVLRGPGTRSGGQRRVEGLGAGLGGTFAAGLAADDGRLAAGAGVRAAEERGAEARGAERAWTREGGRGVGRARGRGLRGGGAGCGGARRRRPGRGSTRSRGAGDCRSGADARGTDGRAAGLRGAGRRDG